MKFVSATIVFAAALIAAGCQPAAPEGAQQSTTAPTAAAPVSFTVDPLHENDTNIQGCSTMLARVGGAPNAGDLFVSSGGDASGNGFIRINGNLLEVDLVNSNLSETGGTRTFADKAHTVQVVETTVTGAAHEEADSVEQSGTLTVTFGGQTQTIEVQGGTAC